MKIRTAVRGDLAAIAACRASAFEAPCRPVEGDGARSHARLLEQIDNGEIRVVAKDDLVLGFISFATNHEHLFVDTIAVLPRHQRRGIGSRLLAAAEKEAAKLGLGHVSLFADAPSRDLNAFYVNRGYDETDRCAGPGFARVFFSKEIAPVTAAAA